MKTQRGKQSIFFNKNVYVASSAAIVGQKEGEGPLKGYFDQVVEDPFFAMDTWEEAESKFVTEASLLAIEKAGMEPDKVRFAFAGDLLGQLIAASFGIKNLEIPFVGLYGACSNIGLALTMGAMTICGDYADEVLCAASSHFCSAEKQFRFPLEYGNQRPQSSTWTVTGCGAFILSNRDRKKEGDKKKTGKENVKEKEKKTGYGFAENKDCIKNVVIKGATIGKIVDYDVKDAQNMGAAMAPAAAHVIYQALNDFNMKADDFDRIITGDLGRVGKEILLTLLKENNIDLKKRHMDCGIEIFSDDEQDTHSGGSGCACSAVVLASYLLKKLEMGEWKRILLVPTGAMFSPTSFNEGQAVPGIAHAVWLEREE